MSIRDEIAVERTRCAGLVQALIESVKHPTALSLVITAEKMFGAPPGSVQVTAERQRCIQIVDAAASQPFDSQPAIWALERIRSGSDSLERSYTDPPSQPFGTHSGVGASTVEGDAEMSIKHGEETPVIGEPLTVDVVGDEIVLDGALPVSAVMTQEAALETGIALINAVLETKTKQ